MAFDEPPSVPDGYGGTVNGWSERFRARASYMRLRGGETVMAGRLAGKQPTVITIREHAKAANVDGTWRARDVRTGEVFNIRSVVLSDDRRHRELTAESGVAIGTAG
ncbi:head-tail adaptor protein [Pseudohoeflea suaedae]|uniref:head-tail adaptor protein n=1 Tax=Pseudohoeflea suaedae TaxID=877384 RepID=UPI001FCE8924|nr:head-tail adaptor protein [Pseudohoeflea suaedae]